MDESVHVPPDMAGQRLDQALARLFPAFSRSRLSDWIRSGQVQVNGRPARPRDRVKGGERIRLRAVVAPAGDWGAEPIDLDVVYEDADLLVINKPAGLVVHPGAGNPAGTLVNALLARDPGLAGLPRAGLIHRLDKDTSGLLVVARSLKAHTALVRQLQARELERIYQAVVQGPMVAGGRVDAPVGRHPVHRTRMAVVERGRAAVTHYRVLRRFRAHTLVRLKLESGRTHQIRVHMAHIGHPLVGDPVYGRPALPAGAGPALVDALRGFRRQALHACRLGLVHPASGEAMAWEIPLAQDMTALVAQLEADLRTHS